jgi:hypothetical protein
MSKKLIFRFMFIAIFFSVVFSLYLNLEINSISSEINKLNIQIIELEREKQSTHMLFIEKYSIQNIDLLSKTNSYTRLDIQQTNRDLVAPYKSKSESNETVTVLGFGK